jgi:DNA-binding CsgD family transcriptional regulator
MASGIGPSGRNIILGSRAVEALSLPVFIVEEGNILAFANPSGDEMLRDQTVIHLGRAGDLRAGHGAQALLSNAVAAVIAGQADQQIIVIGAGANRPPVATALVRSLPDRDRSGGFGQALICVLSNPKIEASTESVDASTENAFEQYLTGALGFTGKQVKICKLLLQGLNTKDIARFMKISVPGVRYHLHRLFLVTDTHSRAEFVLRIANLLPFQGRSLTSPTSYLNE